MILIAGCRFGVSMSSLDGSDSVALTGCGMMSPKAVRRGHGHARNLRCQMSAADLAGQSADALFVRVDGATAQF